MIDKYKTFDPDKAPFYLEKYFNKSNITIAGVNEDDCGIIIGKKGYYVYTTDYINSNPICREFRIGNFRTLGRLVVIANLSDLCGTGAVPQAFLLAITMPRGSKEYEFKEIIRGVKETCLKYNIPVIGGDSKLGKSLAINGTAIGYAKSKNNMFIKNMASPGELVWISGNVGSCSAAIIALKNKYRQKCLIRWAKNIITKPTVSMEKSRLLSYSGHGRAGIDISDGLGRDIYRLCKASNVGVIIDADQIPLDNYAKYIAKKENIPYWSLPFLAGGEYEFVVTTSKRVKTEMRKMGFILIGQTIKEKKNYIKVNKKTMQLPIKGHEDAREMSFSEEIDCLLKEIKNNV